MPVQRIVGRPLSGKVCPVWPNFNTYASCGSATSCYGGAIRVSTFTLITKYLLFGGRDSRLSFVVGGPHLSLGNFRISVRDMLRTRQQVIRDSRRTIRHRILLQNKQTSKATNHESGKRWGGAAWISISPKDDSFFSTEIISPSRTTHENSTEPPYIPPEPGEWTITFRLPQVSYPSSDPASVSTAKQPPPMSDSKYLINSIPRDTSSEALIHSLPITSEMLVHPLDIKP